MNSWVCVDACLALKLVLGEDDSPRAIALWEQWIEADIGIVAPTLLAYEATAVLRSKVYRGLLTPEHGDQAFEALCAQDIQYLSPDNLHTRAWELARQLNCPTAYDAHYLALADIACCPFWTADERLYNMVKKDLSWVHWLLEPPDKV